MQKIKVKKNDRGFWFIEIPHGAHDHQKLIIWINNKIQLIPTEVEDQFTLNFPLENANIQRTVKGGFVLLPEEGSTVFYVEQPSGYRGSSDLGAEKDCEMIVKVHNLHSGRGSLGETCCAFFVTQNKNCQIRWKKTGRRVDVTSGVWRLSVSGDREDLIDDPEICDLL